jgi:hypothetical protein
VIFEGFRQHIEPAVPLLEKAHFPAQSDMPVCIEKTGYPSSPMLGVLGEHPPFSTDPGDLELGKGSRQDNRIDVDPIFGLTNSFRNAYVGQGSDNNALMC